MVALLFSVLVCILLSVTCIQREKQLPPDSIDPTLAPVAAVTLSPTPVPTPQPTAQPTLQPTQQPTPLPTSQPTRDFTEENTVSTTLAPLKEESSTALLTVMYGLPMLVTVVVCGVFLIGNERRIINEKEK
jgi:hypothetical protein